MQKSMSRRYRLPASIVWRVVARARMVVVMHNVDGYWILMDLLCIES